MIANILFVISDLILLFNIIGIISANGTDLSLFSKKIKGLLIAFHIIFAIVFTLYFNSVNDALQFVFLGLYFIRFLFVQFYITRKLSFNMLYLPTLIISLDSLLQCCVFWALKQFLPHIDKFSVVKSVSFVFQIILFALIYYIRTHDNHFTKSLIFGLKLVSKSAAILVLISVFITEGIISLITYSTSEFALQQNLIAFFLIILVVIVFVILFSLLINSISKKYFEGTSKLMEEQVKTQLSHYETLNEIKHEYRSFRHDYKNHMHCIRSLIDANKIDEASTYIDKLSDAPIINTELFETGNHILDAILNDKTSKAAKTNTRFSVSGVFSDSFEPVDLCTIFSNLLDNAIEACALINGDKIIKIDLKMQQGYQLISISNPINNIENQNLSTTKNDKERHGFGISNVKNAVSRHGGELVINRADGNFTVDITLKI